MVARGAIRSIKVATASHFLFADCRFIAGVLVVGVKQVRGGFCSGWSWCRTAADIKHLFLTLDACCWRYCLFPEPWLKTLKFLNSPSAQTARIFTRLSQWFYTVNNQRLNNRHLRLDELFSEGRCLALLFFRSGAVFVALRILVHYEILCRQLFYTTSLPESGLMPVVGATAYF